MTKILIEYKNNDIVFLQAKGHTEYGKQGDDIVCSAVSTAMAIADVGLMKYLKDDQYIKKLSNNNAIMSFRLKNNITKQDSIIVQAILSTVIETLRSIEFEYKNYVSMEEKNV